MLYPVALKRWRDREPAFEVIVPDIEGCRATGATLAAALHNATAAVRECIEALVEAGKHVPAPSRDIEMLAARPEFAGYTWGQVWV